MSSFVKTTAKLNNQLCRICVCETDDLKSLFNHLECEEIQEEGVTTLADVLFRITTETINPEDNLPLLLCTKCAELTYSAYLFKLKYEKSYDLFQEYIITQTEKKVDIGKEVDYAHMSTHRHDRYVECSQCGKLLSGKQQLRHHMLIHTGEKPYVCHVCGKSFNKMYNLQVHERIHKGERRHVCTVCNKGFLEKSYLRKHMNVHRNSQL